MSMNGDIRRFFAEQGFWPHQVNFADQFISGDPRWVLLSSPVGTGRSRLAIGIAAAVANSDERARILLVAPARVLLDQFKQQLAEFAPHRRIINLDRKAWRSLQSAKVDLTDPCIFLSTRSTLGDPDIKRAVSSVDWELVVLDEVQAASRAGVRELIDSLKTSGCVKRLLALTSTKEGLNVLGDIEHVTWTWSEFASDLPPALVQALSPHPVTYSRNSEESRFWDALNALKKTHLVASDALLGLYDRAYSSLYAAEITLRRVGAPTDVADVDTEEGSRSIDQLTDTDLSAGYGSLNVGQAKTLLDLLEKVTSDSKLSRLSDLIDETVNVPVVVVCTTFSDTARYLAAGLAEKRERVGLVTGSSESEETARELSSANVVVVTDAALIHRRFASGVRIIHYDLPRSASRFADRIIRLVGPSPADTRSYAICHREELGKLEKLVHEAIGEKK